MNFTDTQTDYLDSRVSSKTIEENINNKFHLGGGTYLRTRLLVSPTTISVVTRVEGVSDINKMSPSVIRKYARAIKAINAWENGESPDFPDIGNV